MAVTSALAVFLLHGCLAAKAFSTASSGKRLLTGSFAWSPLRQLHAGARTTHIMNAASLETGLFDLNMLANQAVDSGLSGLAAPESPWQTPALLPLLLFGAGVASSVNPCSAAALPAAVASVAALGQSPGGAAAQALAFTAGSSVVLASLGLAVLLLGGEALSAGGALPWLFPVVAVLMGLSLLDILPLSLSGLQGAPRQLLDSIPRELRGFGLGMLSAIGATPCATPVFVTIVSFLAANPQGTAATSALLLAYAAGYNTPLLVLSASASALPVLQVGSTWGPLLTGTAILAVGTAQLSERVRDIAGTESIAPLALVACVCAWLATPPSVESPSQRAAANAEVTPVAGERGVYMYKPVKVEASVASSPLSSSVQASPWSDLQTQRRLAVSAALVAGIGASGTLMLPESSEAKTPQQMIVSAFSKSRPLTVALQSGKPVIVDFTATWCPDCLKTAPSMLDLEQRYGKEVEFVMLDATCSDPETKYWAKEFGVDGIPHLAFVTPSGSVPTALVGMLPLSVLEEEVVALRDGQELPYTMYDAFKGRVIRPLPVR